MTQMMYRYTEENKILRNIFYGLCVITVLSLVGFVPAPQKDDLIDAHTQNIKSVQRALIWGSVLVLLFFTSRWLEPRIAFHKHLVLSSLLIIYLMALFIFGWQDILRFYLHQLIMIGVGLVILAFITSIARSDQSRPILVTIFWGEMPVSLILLIFLYYLQKWGVMHLSSHP